VLERPDLISNEEIQEILNLKYLKSELNYFSIVKIT